MGCQHPANGEPTIWEAGRAMRRGVVPKVPRQQSSVPLTRQDSRGFETHRAHQVTCSLVRFVRCGPANPKPTEPKRIRDWHAIVAGETGSLSYSASGDLATWTGTCPTRHGVSTARFLRVQVRVMRWRAAAPSECAGSQLAGHPNGFPDEGDLRREEDVPLVGPRLRAACPVMHLSLAGSTRDFARRAGPRWALPCGCRAAIGAMRAGTSWRGRGASWWRGGELSE
jgi:hypothetical protein